MSSITETISSLNQRVGALETTNYDDSSGISRITKIYGNVRVTVTVIAFTHIYRKCGDTAPLFGATCGTDTYL